MKLSIKENQVDYGFTAQDVLDYANGARVFELARSTGKSQLVGQLQEAAVKALAEGKLELPHYCVDVDQHGAFVVRELSNNRNLKWCEICDTLGHTPQTCHHTYKERQEVADMYSKIIGAGSLPPHRRSRVALAVNPWLK